MFVEASSGGASVGTGDISGGNNVDHECRIEIDQRFSEQEKKQFNQNEESSDERFNEEDKEQFVSLEKALKVVDKTCPPADAKPKIQKLPSMLQDNEESSEQEKKQFDQNEGSSDQSFSEEEKMQFSSFDKVLKKVNSTSQPFVKPNIQKVSYMLRNNNNFKKYFQPKVFSFGPYYHPSSPYRPHKMDKPIKVNLAAKFLQQYQVKKEDLYVVIKKKIKDLKDCYDNELTNNYKDKDHELAWMFLVDGCAILQFMYIFVDLEANPEEQFKKLGIKSEYALFLVRDLFLLESQLPYQLLQLIIQQTSKEVELLESIYKFIFYYIRRRQEWNENKKEILTRCEQDHGHDYAHLLDLLRKMLIKQFRPIDEKRGLIGIITDWTVDLFDKLKCNRNEVDRDRAPDSLRNIGKLREAGINLKRSKTRCVADISFSGSTLKLPPIIVEESTATMFLNMLGYEICPDFHNESEVSSYLYLMDKLIDQTQDVEELREKNILMNELGCDLEVVKLINEISKHVFPNLEYYKVKSKIDKYFDNKGLMWLHKFSHDIHQYFRGRWSLLAFIGAFLAVVASIIQTVLTGLAYQAGSKKGV